MRKFLFLGALLIGGCDGGGGDARSANGALDPTGYVTAAGYLSCLEGRGAVVSAHRGGPRPGFPENAIETIERTLGEIPALIEIDVRETADNVLVLLHDETVDRTTNGSGVIREMTWEEASSLRLVDAEGTPTDFRIPRLDEVLGLFAGRTVLQLDVKRGVGLGQVAEAVEAAGAESGAAIITYSPAGARQVAEASDGVSVVVGFDDHDMALTARFVSDRLREANLTEDRVIGWTGLTGAPEPAIWEALGERSISASGGAIGSIDRRAASGERGLYLALEDAGVDIVATDRPLEAARELGTGEIIAAAEACLAR
jgi:glycerophosphoryl diester phosphodiesterase